MIEADFRREYRLTPRDIAALTWRQFWTLLYGLSPGALYRHVARNAPLELSGERAADFIDTL